MDCAIRGQQEARRATEEASASIDATDVTCAFVGIPKPVSAKALPGLQPGAALPLVHEGGRANFLLCARIAGNNWLVTVGDFEEDRPGDNPFGANTLTEKDLTEDQVRDATPPPPGSKGTPSYFNALDG